MRYLNVPMIRQEKSMSCWHASARMLWAFKYKQSINPLKKMFNANTGIAPAQFVRLAKTLGLETVPRINMTYTATAVATLLKRYGPLWVAGHWYGTPHIVVVTGVESNGKLYVNDPGFGSRIHDMLFFNEKIASKVSNPIMYLPNSKANQKGYRTFFK